MFTGFTALVPILLAQVEQVQNPLSSASTIMGAVLTGMVTIAIAIIINISKKVNHIETKLDSYMLKTIVNGKDIESNTKEINSHSDALGRINEDLRDVSKQAIQLNEKLLDHLRERDSQ